MNGVHSTQVLRVGGGMNPCAPSETLPFEAGDPEWVAGLLDTMQAGDLDAIVEQLNELLQRTRKAAKARRMLAGVGPDLMRAGHEARARRGAS